MKRAFFILMGLLFGLPALLYGINFNETTTIIIGAIFTLGGVSAIFNPVD